MQGLGRRLKNYFKILLIVLLLVVMSACSIDNNNVGGNSDDDGILGSGALASEASNQTKENEGDAILKNYKSENIRTIYLAGGCFWGVEGYFSKVPGVVDAVSGYANGASETTSYYDLKDTDHAETVEIKYDMSVISLEEILLHYFRIIEPTSVNKQGNDIGRQYRTGVYYTDEAERAVIDKVFEKMASVHGKLAVETEALANFIPAEEYHQDYLDKNPNGYCHINLRMATEPLFEEAYQNPEDSELKDKLDDLSYAVLRESDTERPFTSPLNEEHRKGIYVDKITGQPLFASQDKFDSGCGWPSFSKPILTDKIEYVEDNSHGMNRIEVRSSGGDNHLGHVFEDGPADKGGKRYCINGASLEFIPYEEMDERGYSEYKVLCE